MNNAKMAYLLAGGNFSNPKSSVPLFGAALRECGKEKPRVAYIGAASGDSFIFFRIIRALIKEAGAGEVFMLRLAKENIDIDFTKQALEDSDAVFITGGEVIDGMRWIGRHGLCGFLKELHAKGKLFFGISAGSIMMGSHWVKWENEKDDSTASLFDCLGFAPVIFDTHAENEDWRELKLALKLKGEGALGYAIPSGGMAGVDGEGNVTSLEKTLIPYVNKGGEVGKE